MTRSYVKHGRTNTSEYTIWESMKQRCLNPNANKYSNYGGRGIKICSSWVKSFSNFYDDMGDRPEGMSLDREDNEGHYTPENCRWATASQQNCNRRPKLAITFDDRTQSLKEWADDIHVSYAVLYARLFKLNWNITKALTTPHRYQS